MVCVVLDVAPPQWFYALTLFCLFKWVFNYRKCTVSYVEVKVRGVVKDDGYLYRFLNALVDFRYSPYIGWVYLVQGGFILYYGTKTNCKFFI